MEFEAYLEQLQAEAEHQGSGAFTCDLNRMQKVLGAFQLATPEEYVLPVLCAAVLNCANWFRLEEQEGATVLSWDGPPLTLAQLHQLLPSLTQPGSLLGELAVGLLAARRLGEVCLQSSHGQFHFRGQQVVVETLGRDGPNLMTLRRKWWCRLLRRSRISAQILRDRCRFAPLQLTPHQAPEAVTAPLVLCAGHTRADWLTAEEWVDLPDCPWGRGLLYLGQAPWQVIRHGVTYTLPSPLEGVVAVWWSDALPLDLSRKELQRGPEFEAWLSWLHEQLSSLVITRNLTEQLASLVKSGLNSNQSLFIDAPLFRCADGSYTSLAAIRADYREHGWLPTVTRPMLLGWEPQRVAVVEKPHEQALCKIFPNWLKLDHLENETNLPRLPEDEEYVVRIPCLIGRGEAGLRRYPSSFAFRQFSYGQWQELRSLPFGVDVARESLESGVLPIGELYWTLQFITLGDTFAHLWDLHMLVMLGWLRAALLKVFQRQYASRHPLEVLLDPKSQARIDHVKGKIRSPQLLTIASKLKLSLHSGEVIELQSLCQPGRNRILTDNCLYGPADHLAVGHCTGVVLPHLFLPGTVAYPSPSGPEAVLVTEATQTLVRGVSGPVHLLRRLVEYKQCGAYKMLESSGRLAEVRLAADELSDQKPHTGVAAAIQRAVFEMHSSIRLLSTSYLLVALADEPVLSSAGLSRQQLTPLLLEWAEFEGRQELLEVSPWAAADPKTTFDVKVSLVWSYLYSARFEEARRLTRSDLCVGPRRQLGLMLLGLAESLSGDLETGLQHFSEAAQLSSESVYATCCAESLMWLGRIDEAREACPTGDDQYTLTIRASLADSPEECLRLCDQAEQAGPGQYFELAEARGQAYFKLGRKSEARECFSRFLQARRDNSMLDHFEARMDRARRLLES